MVTQVSLDNVEKVYLLEAVDRLHHDNVVALQAILEENHNEISFSRDDVYGLMRKEGDLYRQLKQKLERS